MIGASVMLAVLFGALSPNLELDEHWNLYKKTFDKVYDGQEEILRRSIFEKNVQIIQHHNILHDLGVHKFRLGLNQFTDWHSSEYSRMNGARVNNKTHGEFGHQHLNKMAAPNSIDWRTRGYVTPVKNQGQCGSCWAFSSTGAMEGAHFRVTNRLVSLSEQNLVDCVHNGNQGCSGGWMNTAFQYVIHNHGIDTESSYPYTAQDGSCHYNSNSVGARITKYTDVPKNEAALQNAVATIGPVSVAIDASRSSFMMYKGGIYYDPNCQQVSPDHAVLVVGYGTENGQDYWIVKNSWNTNWGEQGYIRIARHHNMCGIANYASYPTV